MSNETQTQTNPKWTHVFGKHWEHSLWLSPTDNRVALTDGSLRYVGRPETTDDGLLIVDTKMPITCDERGYRFLPLLDAKGKRCSAIISKELTKYCVDTLRMTFVPLD